MFSYDSLLNRRRLEDFLNSEPKESNNPPKEEKLIKDNFIRKTIDYFTGKSNIWYTYSFNQNKNDIEYNFPRTLLEDIKNLRDYFVNLFSKD